MNGRKSLRLVMIQKAALLGGHFKMRDCLFVFFHMLM
ncbi:hypothetical protein B2K_39150 [Paenibacillus mucilaginosus K02]|uniref:Uncharacterized protein n=1 Tax=Paenibacillus mucilaginosus K02 TaxID=997761 RepID=R9ULD0_9BACL|nr:hypothetical protein B2K_39150 [Paenibacillus mucilaginosus K02]